MGYDSAAFFTGFGADVDEVVGLGHDGGVVFYDDDGVAFVHQAVEDVDEFVDVLSMEADGGFFDEVEVFVRWPHVADVGAAFGELGDELDALGLASAQCR